jgi:peroxiredoxin
MSTTTRKLAAGSDLPALRFSTLAHGEMTIEAIEGWRLLVVYRGKHCPLCKTYLKTLESMKQEFHAAGVSVAVVSADPKEKARAEVAEFGWTFPVGYGLTPEQMRALGLYISTPRSEQETDRPFAEPGLFAINPEGKVQIVDISNAPFARPDLALVLRGINFAREKGYPIRGTML